MAGSAVSNIALSPEAGVHAFEPSGGLYSYRFEPQAFIPAEVFLHKVPRVEWRFGDRRATPNIGDVVSVTVGRDLPFSSEVHAGDRLEGIVEGVHLDGCSYPPYRNWHCYKIAGKWVFEQQIDFNRSSGVRTAVGDSVLRMSVERDRLLVSYPAHIIAPPLARQPRLFDLVRLLTRSGPDNSEQIVQGQLVGLQLEVFPGSSADPRVVYFVGSSQNPGNLRAVFQETLAPEHSVIFWPSMAGAALGDEIACTLENGGGGLSGKVTRLDFNTTDPRIGIGGTNHPLASITSNSIRVLTPFHDFNDVEADFVD